MLVSLAASIATQVRRGLFPFAFDKIRSLAGSAVSNLGAQTLGGSSHILFEQVVFQDIIVATAGRA